MMEKTLLGVADEPPLYELEAFIRPRVEEAINGELSHKSVDDIFDEAIEGQQTQ
jgi:hypothetical protein